MQRSRLILLLILALLGLTGLAYARLGSNEFVSLDDPLYISDNPMVRMGLTGEGLLWAWTTYHASNWHPVTWLSLQLDAQLFGPRPAAFHFVNLLLHAGNVLLFFVALRQMTGAIGRSALAAALFAVHPLHVESVAWAAERKDVLSVFWGLLALLAYIRHAARPGWLPYTITCACFAVSLLAKPTLVTLPFALLLIDYWPLGRVRRFPWMEPTASATENSTHFTATSFGWLLIEKVPLLVLSLLSSRITMLAQAEGGAVLPLEALPVALRLENALVAVAGYVYQTLWPVRLGVFYPHPMGHYPLWQVAAAALLVIGMTVLALVQARRRPYLLVGWLWFLGTLVPVIGLVQVGDQARADRYTYVPHLGLFVLAVWGMSDLLAAWRWPLALRGALAVGVLAVWSALTWVQVGYWRNSITLWEHTLSAVGPSYRAHANLGAELADRGRYREAVPHLQAALSIQAHDAELHLLLGETLLNLHRDGEAVAALQKAVAIQAVPPRTLARAYLRLAQGRLRQGMQAEGRAELTTALRLDPTLAEAYGLLGWLNVQDERFHEARECFGKALRFKPEYAAAHLGMGSICLREGESLAAAQHYSQALALDDSAEAHRGLGLARGMSGDWPRAIEHLEEAVGRNPDSAAYRRDLALALHESGRSGDAAVEYGESLRRAPDWPRHVGRLAWTLATHPDEKRRAGPEAVRLARQACQATDNQDPALLDVLAAALAESGDFEKAGAVAQQAGALARSAGQTALEQQIESRVQKYRQRQPHREPPSAN